MSTDSSVIERSFQEPTRFGELFQRHAGRIHRFIARRAGPTVADDVVGETFLVAFERRSQFDLNRENALPWLLGIATNLLHRHRVAEARSLRMLERNTAEPTTMVPDPAAIAATRDDTKRLARDLRKLAKRDRDVLLLFAWENLSYEEIARALAIPLGTVR